MDFMSLYEIQTGYVGESFVRCYIWTYSEPEALIMFKTKYSDQKVKQIKRLFSAGAEPFVTDLSDSGFEREKT
jgi:hypothetical protein